MTSFQARPADKELKKEYFGALKEEFGEEEAVNPYLFP